ncbi:serpin family protein [Botryobacter ruber]|uniref:serpin family protein n=1 Tax=Botryobacter ruber TaxID=2171629 RepID=UPI000E0BD19D|nr:serpin family protein [Botryobacter ruber]
MKNFIKTSVAGLAGAVLLLSACQKEITDSTPDVRPVTAQEATAIKSSNNFAFRAFASISEDEGTKNVFISPLSISMALGMAYNGADGATKEAMRKTLALELPTDNDINQAYKSLSELLPALDKKVQFRSANSLWYRNTYQLQAPFVKTNQTYFDATVQGLNFDSPAAKDQINSWVQNKTNDKIDKIVEEIRPEHVLFLVNAIYFKGTWTYPFDKKLTQPGLFRLENGSTVTHDFMHLKNGKYLLYQDNTKQLIDLPYGNRHFSMTILLPQGQQQVSDLVNELTGENLAAWLAAADTSGMELYLPKFKLAYEKELKETLTQLGMGIAFSNSADFSQMVEGRSDLAISEVKHKTFVEVNEEGTEAAAVTSVGVSVTSMPPSIRVDRPFVFLIREKSSGAILFIGKLMQPE